MKAFDQMPDGTVKEDKEFNNKIAAHDLKIIETQKKHEETNKGLKIEMRNKIAAHFMRIVLPESIVEEIIEMKDKDDKDFIANLTHVLDQCTKSFLKHNYNIEKKLNIVIEFDGRDSYTLNPGEKLPDESNLVVKGFMFFGQSGDGVTKFEWGKEKSQIREGENELSFLRKVKETDHALQPATSETIKHERGILLLYPSFVTSSSRSNTGRRQHMSIKVSYHD
jgi:hypothetical protein|tara:strand:- start:16297 stop:16965 length:669 start_codon:yes stop_codon:yes gene_type:complete